MSERDRTATSDDEDDQAAVVGEDGDDAPAECGFPATGWLGALAPLGVTLIGSRVR